MLPESPGAGGPADSEPLIFVSDASAEAERLTTALRMRGYVVIDVPLTLLVSRVAVQRPSIILCDVDAPGALGTVGSLRDVPGGSGVDIIFIGEPGGTLDDMADAVFHESSGFFVRPVDVYALLRKVEALIGPPSTTGSSIVPSSQRTTSAVAPSLRPSFPLPPEQPPAPKVASSNPPRRLSSPPPRSAPPMDGPLLQMPPSSGPRDSNLPSLPPPVPLGFGMEGDAPGAPLARAIPQSTMSPELERLLARAEQRVAGNGSASPSMAPVSDRLTPEDEVEAVLPADVLAALDEPLADDSDDEELGSAGGPGTHSGSEAGRTGLGGSTGTGRTNPGGGATTGHTPVATGPGSTPPSAPGGVTSAQAAVTVPPARTGPGIGDSNNAISEPPATPPAMPTRPPVGGSWPPVSAGAATRLGTAVESLSQPPPRAPSEPPAGTQHGVPPSGDLQPLEPPPGADASTRPPGRAEAPPVAAARRVPPVPAASPPEALPSTASADAPRAESPSLSVPPALGAGDTVRALARVVRARYTGALVFEDAAGIRRVVVRDGDFVTVASGVDGESLVAFLKERGVVGPEVMAQLGRKVAQFGRHAGAALIAHGHLRQDELWPVLRAHAEWLLGRIVGMTQGAASLEPQVPARLQAEPAVFGGATGAEVLVEIVRRCVAPKDALALLGGGRARLAPGPSPALLTECALSDTEMALVSRAHGGAVDELLESASSPDFATVLHALVELGILDAMTPTGDEREADAQRPPVDRLDEQALRARIVARSALVEEGDYFAILGVSRRATGYDIKRAYLELRGDFEPSRILTPGTADLRDQVDAIREIIDEAYDILRDQLRRERYRRALESPPR